MSLTEDFYGLRSGRQPIGHGSVDMSRRCDFNWRQYLIVGFISLLLLLPKCADLIILVWCFCRTIQWHV